MRPDDLELWSTAAYLLGRVDRAVEILARAYRIHHDEEDPGAAIRCAFWAVFMLVNRGDMAQAGGWVARAGHDLAELPEDCVERGYLMVLEAFRATTAERRYEEGWSLADRVAAMARAARDRDLEALALNVAGRALIRGGHTEEGFVRLDEAMLAVVSDELSPPVSGTTYCSVIEACEEIWEHGRAQEWTQALTRWCDRQQGMITFTGPCLVHRATILCRLGEWAAAAGEVALACERFSGAADEIAVGNAYYRQGEIRRLGGDHPGAEEAYRRAAEAGRDPQPGLARLRLAEGRAKDAAAATRRLVSELDDPVQRIGILPAHVEAMLAVDDVAAAREAVDELARLAETYPTAAFGAEVDQARGAVLLAADDAEAALAPLRQACSAWRSLDSPYETARVRALIGRACRALGDDDTAAIELDLARQAFADLGAADDLAGLAGPGPEPAHGLSPRELEVLRLVATGRTNQAIADELFLAVRTIDRHVANILTKLDVPSRTAATAYAYEHELL